MRVKTEKSRLPACGRPVRLPRGLTLVELLVSLGLIAFIAMAFGTILGQARQLVSTSQSVIRANSAASAIAQVIREDLAGLSKEGFLAIYMPNPNEYHLVFTATGVFKSQSQGDPNKSNAVVIDYGLDKSKNTLWRRARLLIAGGPNDAVPKDTFTVNGYLGLYHYGSPSVDANTYSSPPPTIPSWPYGPDSPDKLWPVLATECTGFKVEWLDRGPPPPLKWTTTADFWTHADDVAVPPTHPWPAAVKVTFGLRMGDKTSDAMQYEVICPIMRD